MRKITKITNLKLVESFCQINYLKGFKYIDSAGQILNLYQKNDGTVKYQMSPDQLVIYDPTKEIQELKVANFDIWLHFTEPNNLGEVERLSLQEMSKILPIIDVEDLLRIGWRNFYILELDDSQKNKFEKILETDGGKINGFTMVDESKDIKLAVNVSLVIKNDHSKKPAILFDLDTFQKDKISRSTIKEKFEKIRDSINGDSTLKLINAIIKKI